MKKFLTFAVVAILAVLYISKPVPPIGLLGQDYRVENHYLYETMYKKVYTYTPEVVHNTLLPHVPAFIAPRVIGVQRYYGYLGQWHVSGPVQPADK